MKQVERDLSSSVVHVETLVEAILEGECVFFHLARDWGGFDADEALRFYTSIDDTQENREKIQSALDEALVLRMLSQ